VKISIKDRETVLSIIRQNHRGLSISELSRKSDINRNKISAITEMLQNEDLINCTHQYHSKIVSMKYPSAVHSILETIAEPSLIVDETLQVIQVNSSYSEMVRTDVLNHLGKRIDELSHILPDNLVFQLQHLLEGKDGEKSTQKNQTGVITCTCIRITLIDEKPGILIIMHLQKHTGDDSRKQDLSCEVLHTLSAKIHKIMQRETRAGAYSLAASCIHTVLPDDLVFTLMVDESGTTGTLNSLFFSGTSSKNVMDGMTGIIEKIPAIPIREQNILHYKRGQPVVHDTILDIFQENQVPDKIADLFRTVPVETITGIGIIVDTILIGILGIGTTRENYQSLKYDKILLSASAFLSPIGMVYRLLEAKTDDVQKYQGHYRNIYRLLTEKTQEDMLHLSESRQLRSLLAAVLDRMNISLITTTGNGTITFINQTALQTYHIDIHKSLGESDLSKTLPADVAGSLMDLTKKEINSEIFSMNQNTVVDMNPEVPVTWYYIRYPNDLSAGECIFIGEKNPAPLISYLNSLEPE